MLEQNIEVTELKKEIEKLNVKIEKIQNKYRNKYMQLEHERRAWSLTKDKLNDIIYKLRVELIENVPSSKVIETVDKITEISSPKHISNKTKTIL